MAVAIRGDTPAVTIVTSASISVTLSGTRQPQAGDVLLIQHVNDFYAAANMPTPSVGGSTTGVTEVTDAAADGGTNAAHSKTWVFKVVSTGDLTVSVTETGQADEDKALLVWVLSGVDTTSPVDAAASATGTLSSSQVAPSVSPSTSDAYLVCTTNTGGGSTAGGSGTPPSGMTEVLDQANGGMLILAAVEQLDASGATGTRTFSPAGTAAYAAVTVALRTATGGTTVTGTASATLGGLAAAATGTRRVLGTATAALGAITATATGTRRVLGTAAAALGRLVATAVSGGGITLRPDTGTTSRPDDGVTTRPDLGVTQRP